jgi:aminopeptidase N
MSTYLLAFIVSNYKGSLTNTEKFGVYARPESQSHTDYAVEFGVNMLNKFDEYFNISYYDMENLEKMDMAGIPDFSAGGELN